MAHALVMGLFDRPASAAVAAQGLRSLGIPQERVSIVARSHDDEVSMARAAGASPGTEIEDSPTAARLGELGGHLLAAIALVMPGIGPIVADGPLAAGLGEAAGHLAGGVARTLHHAGMPAAEAGQIEASIERGHVLIGAHVDDTHTEAVSNVLDGAGAISLHRATWPDSQEDSRGV